MKWISIFAVFMAILKVLGAPWFVALSWWTIAGVFFFPLLLGIVIFGVACVGALIIEFWNYRN